MPTIASAIFRRPGMMGGRAMDWAPRVKQSRLRRLYRSARTGQCDITVLADVGLTLYARCQDVVAVARAFHLGQVPCPACGEIVRRQKVPAARVNREEDVSISSGTGDRAGWFHCDDCQRRLLWRDCRDALRREPRCFECHAVLARWGDTLRCACGVTWDRRRYELSVSRRVRLPCPHCGVRLRRPSRPQPDQGERPAAQQEFPCPKCDGLALREGGALRCRHCGHERTWRSYWRQLKRRDEALTCGACGHAFSWQAWRREALGHRTGNLVVARQFMDRWDLRGTAEERMMHLDLLVQALHGRGALGPLFIEGDEGSVRRLLDELAGERTPGFAH